MSDIYQVTLDRENLDALMNQLAMAHKVEINIDDNNNISFNIPRGSTIEIKSKDIVTEMYKEIEKFQKRKDKLKTNGKRKADLENTISGMHTAIEVVSKLLAKG